MRKKHPFTLTAALVLLASPIFASESRVDSVGGLNLVLSDETQAINPFNFGNPAGLILLTPQNRFDVAGQWFKQSIAISGRTNYLYGTLGEFDSKISKYHGLMLFPDKLWAVQLDGDLFHYEDPLQQVDIDQSRELFRAAYNFGPFVLGGQIRPTQSGVKLKSPTFQGGQLISGKADITTWEVTGGLLACFPGDPGPKQERFMIGGTYSRNVIPPKEVVNINFIPSGGPPNVLLTQTVTGDSIQTIGPEIYFESPGGTFQAAAIGRLVTSSGTFQQDSPDVTYVIPSYKLQEGSETAGVAGFKAAHPLGKALALKSGAAFVFDSKAKKTFDPAGAVLQDNTSFGWQAQVGFGVEKLEDFTFGLQAHLNVVNGTNKDGTGVTTGTIDYLGYKIALGGERWLSKKWAFRLGFIFQNDRAMGDQDYQTFYYPIPHHQRVINTLITSGLGFKDSFFRSDLYLWYGQPTLYDNPSPEAYGTQLGAQLAASILFN
jgi:hypothetical protein